LVQSLKKCVGSRFLLWVFFGEIHHRAMRRTRSDCCALATTDYVAALPTPAMNVRRLIQ